MNLKLTKVAKARKLRITKQKAALKPSAKFPMQLIVRENTYGYRSKPLSAVLKGFDRLRHDRYLWLNERTAKKCKLQDGMLANIVGQHADLELPVKIDPDIPDNSVLLYYHPSMGYIPCEPVRLECTK